MKKKILIPTDFSKNAWTAFTFACDLYKGVECEFYVLNVFQATGYALESMLVPEPGESTYEQSKKESEEGLRKLQEMLSFRGSNYKHEFYYISQFNSLLEAVNDIVSKKDIDMVVMGTKGATNSKKVAFGSNAVDLMEGVRACPVLVIPEGVRYGGINEMVFPTNFKTQFKHRELDRMVEIAQISGAAIRVLYVSAREVLNLEQENFKSLLEENLQGLEYSFHTLRSKDVAQSIQNFVESRNSEFIAFVNSKHFLIGSIFSNPLVKKLGAQSEVPVLTMHT